MNYSDNFPQRQSFHGLKCSLRLWQISHIFKLETTNKDSNLYYSHQFAFLVLYRQAAQQSFMINFYYVWDRFLESKEVPRRKEIFLFWKAIRLTSMRTLTTKILIIYDVNEHFQTSENHRNHHERSEKNRTEFTKLVLLALFVSKIWKIWIVYLLWFLQGNSEWSAETNFKE